MSPQPPPHFIHSWNLWGPPPPLSDNRPISAFLSLHEASIKENETPPSVYYKCIKKKKLLGCLILVRLVMLQTCFPHETRQVNEVKPHVAADQNKVIHAGKSRVIVAIAIFANNWYLLVRQLQLLFNGWFDSNNMMYNQLSINNYYTCHHSRRGFPLSCLSLNGCLPWVTLPTIGHGQPIRTKISWGYKMFSEHPNKAATSY